MSTIDRLRELEQAATPGPWRAEVGNVTSPAVHAPDRVVLSVPDEWFADPFGHRCQPGDPCPLCMALVKAGAWR